MPSVLVIEDDDSVRAFLSHALQGADYDYRVLEARNGREGLERLRRGPVDVVITDILLGGKEGFEVIVTLRLEYPGVRIIAISGEGVIGHLPLLQVARNLGAHRTFKKPFDINDLLHAVKEEIGG